MSDQLRLQTLGRLRLTGREGELLPRRRMDLVLLVVLADRAPEMVRREELLALFWGERQEEKARGSLRHVLLRLRRACGDALEVGPEAVRVRAGAINYDAREFVEAANDARYADALELWTGDFLAGCEDVGDESLRNWQDRERVRLRRVLEHCFDGATAARESAGDASGAVQLSARWAALFPLEERSHLRHIELLSQAGRIGEADAARDAFVHAVDIAFDDTPSLSWDTATRRAIAAAREAQLELRAQGSSPDRYMDGALRAATRVASAPSVEPVATSIVPRATTWRRRLLTFSPLLLVALIVGWRLGMVSGISPQHLTVAIGRIEILDDADSAAVVTQLLEIGLGRAAELRVLSEGRMEAVIAQMHADGDSTVSLHDAARVAGADIIIEGVLSRRGNDWRLDVRRVDVGTGEALQTRSVEASDLIDLVDRATARIARDMGATLPNVRLAGATASSAAYLLYQEGLRAFYEGNVVAAQRLFDSALAQDSQFAIAAYYAARVAPNHEIMFKRLEQAVRAADDAPDRDRLFIRSGWLAHLNDPAQFAVAETLVVRYPAEPDAHQQYAIALLNAGRFLEALPHFRQIIAMDSLSLRGLSARCLACDAYYGIAESYRRADSLAAAERVSREWVRLQPNSRRSWGALTEILTAQGRFPEAVAAMQSAPRFNESSLNQMDLWIRTGDFVNADRFWRSRLQTVDTTQRFDALEAGLSSMLAQGRYHEALGLARRMRQVPGDEPQSIHEAYRHATALFALGQHRASGLLFDSIAAVPFSPWPSRNARHRAWMLSLAAGGYAAAGDTARLRILEDSVRTDGGRSSYRRDQLLHHYVRALRLRLAGRTREAIDAFRMSIYSPVDGNSRAVLELARTLIDAGRAAEAVTLLRAAIAGPVGASGQYTIRTELHETLANAYDRIGEKQLAAQNYRYVVHAWAQADPSLHERRAIARERLRVLSGQ